MHEIMLNLWKSREMTIFMVTHDLNEGFRLGTRLLVFDKPRWDPQEPDAYGATITYDLPLEDAADIDLSHFQTKPTEETTHAEP